MQLWWWPSAAADRRHGRHTVAHDCWRFRGAVREVLTRERVVQCVSGELGEALEVRDEVIRHLEEVAEALDDVLACKRVEWLPERAQHVDVRPPTKARDVDQHTRAVNGALWRKRHVDGPRVVIAKRHALGKVVRDRVSRVEREAAPLDDDATLSFVHDVIGQVDRQQRALVGRDRRAARGDAGGQRR